MSKLGPTCPVSSPNRSPTPPKGSRVCTETFKGRSESLPRTRTLLECRPGCSLWGHWGGGGLASAAWETLAYTPRLAGLLAGQQ